MASICDAGLVANPSDLPMPSDAIKLAVKEADDIIQEVKETTKKEPPKKGYSR